MTKAWRSFGGGAALILLLTLVAYLPALRGGFIWDDDDHLTQNPAMLSVDGLKQIWSSLAVSRYYPLTLTSFWVQRRLWGLQPLPYHAVNIALHGVNAVLLWALLRRLPVRGAWVAAAVWAVHPVNVETVAWVTELKNTQSGLFFLGALLAFLRFEDGLRRRDYVIALVCGAAAMLSKPSTVVLPGVMLLCAWWRRGRWTRQDWWRVTPLVALGMGMSLLTVVEQRQQIADAGVSERVLTAAERLVLAGRAVWFYAGKVLWPVNVCFIYPRWELAVHSLVAWLPLAGLVLLAGALWHFRRAGWAHALSFGLGCFIVTLLPVLGFFDIYYFRFSFVADHFQYLAGMGLVALAASAGTSITQRAGQRAGGVGTLVTATVLLVLGVTTWRQAHVYRDPETLWRDTLAKNPNAWIAHNNLGYVLRSQDKVPEAIWHFEETLRIKPDYDVAHYNLGAALAAAGQDQAAIGHFEQALRLKPNYADVHKNLGLALLRVGRIQEAIEHFQRVVQIQSSAADGYDNLGYALFKAGQPDAAIVPLEHAVQLDPGFAAAHHHLGLALMRLGRTQEAADQWTEVLRLEPKNVDAHYNLGSALRALGKVREAIEQYEQALQLKPDFAEAHNNLGSTLMDQGQVPMAIAQYEQALQIEPDMAEAHYNLGLALRQAGRVPEAIGHYQEALRLKPDYAGAHNNLGNALVALGKVSEAIAHYEEALRLKPDYAEAHYNLGVALEQAGRVPEALGHYEQALRLKPDFVEAHFNLGSALERLGRVPEAIEHYERALQIRPDYAEAQHRLARLRPARLGSTE